MCLGFGWFGLVGLVGFVVGLVGLVGFFGFLWFLFFFSFGWFGGPLWYRNARACSPYAIAIKGQDVLEALMNQTDNAGSRDNFVAFCLALCVDNRRGVIDPFARVYFSDAPEEAWPNDGAQFHNDPYFHPAFDQVSPLRLK